VRSRTFLSGSGFSVPVQALFFFRIPYVFETDDALRFQIVLYKTNAQAHPIAVQ